MKLISYNVNGIRSAINKGFYDWFVIEQPDILCIQETRALPEQIDSKYFENLGYNCCWNPAVRKGYSGTGIISKIKFDNIECGIGNDKFDIEGRLIRADFGDITLVCSYFPSGTTCDIRQTFKMNYLNDFTKYIKKLSETRSNIIITGDFNICHKAIDINHPEKHENVSGFLPEERKWFDEFIALGFIDTFREFCVDANRYSWWSYRAGARPKNLGWRIDYFLVSETLKTKLKDADIFHEVIHSDHCPIMLQITN